MSLSGRTKLSYHSIKRAAIIAGIALFTLLVIVTAIAWWQGRRMPDGRPDYVALGSSFAAGAGLGRLAQGSPLLCARSVNGYPQQLARMRQLAIVDMSCGGAVTPNLLRGGQFFQGPQIRTITSATKLVTITVGGNDIGYIGDLSMLAARRTGTVFGRLVRWFWQGPKPPGDRAYPALQRELTATVDAIHRLAPRATVVLATYPAIVPRAGTCARIGLTEAEAGLMRQVGDQLAAVTRSVASQTGSVLVDMHVLGAQHDACSGRPWTAGWANASVAPFHPTLAGAKATAAAISAALDQRPSQPAR